MYWTWKNLKKYAPMWNMWDYAATGASLRLTNRYFSHIPSWNQKKLSCITGQTPEKIIKILESGRIILTKKCIFSYSVAAQYCMCHVSDNYREVISFQHVHLWSRRTSRNTANKFFCAGKSWMSMSESTGWEQNTWTYTINPPRNPKASRGENSSLSARNTAHSSRIPAKQNLPAYSSPQTLHSLNRTLPKHPHQPCRTFWTARYT